MKMTSSAFRRRRRRRRCINRRAEGPSTDRPALPVVYESILQSLKSELPSVLGFSNHATDV